MAPGFPTNKWVIGQEELTQLCVDQDGIRVFLVLDDAMTWE